MGKIEQKPTPASHLGAPENSGISTLERGQKPPTPSGKLMKVKIQMLDDTQEAFEVPQGAPGKVLLDAVCNHLNLVEGDYFGLELPDHQKITQLRWPTTFGRMFTQAYVCYSQDSTGIGTRLNSKHEITCQASSLSSRQMHSLLSCLFQDDSGAPPENQHPWSLVSISIWPDAYHRKLGVVLVVFSSLKCHTQFTNKSHW